ncbi:AraC family transcriptional regulator [Pseudomonas sp. v388]|uniref:AraC family transcriptional regulator n=1 Tax=Pseudomonas sp. v388 TaxID=2479849 RepID=UPI000F79CACC|nr:AraC family transcriptional regulator [Pseudomonas sp. v388]RRV10623.1 AraC family transcriptional regulator [Pseudomonas sp. v388]
MTQDNWIDIAQDRDTGIETLRAHFKGHAYDPHWHDSYLVGVTEQGVQQFNCRRRRHASTAGHVFLLEPGEIHDGEAPTEDGFTYRMLYMHPEWIAKELGAVFEDAPADHQPGFAANLITDPRMVNAIWFAFGALHGREPLMVRQGALDGLLERLTGHLDWRARQNPDPRLPQVALRARDYLHANFRRDVGMDELALATGVDRFRLTRAFRAAFGLPPHAYLVQLRLSRARRLLAQGVWPADAAIEVGFADQSHLGRWFLRVYGLTPAAYRKRCTGLPD